MKILVVDDHPIFQQGLLRILSDEFPEATVTPAPTARKAMASFEAEGWDLVILDLSLPDKSGLEVLKEMKQAHASIPILVLTLHSEDRFAVRAFRAGADGYMTKQSSPSRLGEAIRKILSGGKYVSGSLAEKMAIQLGRGPSQAPQEKLSDREYQVFGLFAQGKTISSIAEELHLSVNTISTYRTRILEKMDLKTTAELVAYAIRTNLID